MGEITRCLRISRAVHMIPSRVMCILLLIVQGASLDYYLISHHDLVWTAWITVDVVVIFSFLISMATSYKHLRAVRRWHDSPESDEPAPDSLPHGYVAWMIYSVGLSARVIVIFDRFAEDLDENDFFGPNTLKATIGLAGLVFMLFLIGLHEAKRNSKEKHYINELTGSIVFDLIDAVESLDILFEEEAKERLLPGMEWSILIIACINFVIPTIPLFTLTKTTFGHKKMSDRLVVFHKLLLAYVVNLPLAISRLVIWHGVSHGISIFLLKNILMVGLLSYDLYEHWREAGEKRAKRQDNLEMREIQPSSSEIQDAQAGRSAGPSSGDDYAIEDRFSA